MIAKHFPSVYKGWIIKRKYMYTLDHSNWKSSMGSIGAIYLKVNDIRLNKNNYEQKMLESYTTTPIRSSSVLVKLNKDLKKFIEKQWLMSIKEQH